VAERKRDLRRRMQTVQNMAEFTRALYLVSAVRLQQAREALREASPYLEKARELSGRVMDRAGWGIADPLLATRPVYQVGVLVITSDTRLCGGCNSGPVRLALELERDLDVPVRYWVVGRQGAQMLRAAGVSPARVYEGIPHRVRLEHVAPIARMVMSEFTSEEVDAVVVVYNRFVSALTQWPEAIPLLPLSREFMAEAAAEAPAAAGPMGEGDRYQIEPEPEALLRALLPQLVTAEVYNTLMQARVSEHAARMRAMKTANNDALELHEKLLSQYRAMRQNEITSQARIVSAAAEVFRQRQAAAPPPAAAALEPSRLKRAVVTSAVRLSPAERGLVRDWVYRRFGYNVDFDWQEDRSLIGGVMVRLDGRVMDYSVTGHLEALRRQASGPSAGYSEGGTAKC
jgi:F-type H+-transporting ATPase subunit gamma